MRSSLFKTPMTVAADDDQVNPIIVLHVPLPEEGGEASSIQKSADVILECSLFPSLPQGSIQGTAECSTLYQDCCYQGGGVVH